MKGKLVGERNSGIAVRECHGILNCHPAIPNTLDQVMKVASTRRNLTDLILKELCLWVSTICQVLLPEGTRFIFILPQSLPRSGEAFVKSI